MQVGTAESEADASKRGSDSEVAGDCNRKIHALLRVSHHWPYYDTTVAFACSFVSGHSHVTWASRMVGQPRSYDGKMLGALPSSGSNPFIFTTLQDICLRAFLSLFPIYLRTSFTSVSKRSSISTSEKKPAFIIL